MLTIKEKTFDFGNIVYKDETINIKIDTSLSTLKIGPAFSACIIAENSKGNEVNIPDKDILAIFKDNCIFLSLHRLLKLYSFNDWHDGNAEQEELVKGMTYDDACEFLKKIGKYEMTSSEGITFQYGDRMYWDIPKEDLDIIESLMSEGCTIKTFENW